MTTKQQIAGLKLYLDQLRAQEKDIDIERVKLDTRQRTLGDCRRLAEKTFDRWVKAEGEEPLPPSPLLGTR